jgi:hypothetical protein
MGRGGHNAVGAGFPIQLALARADLAWPVLPCLDKSKTEGIGL